MNEEKDKQEFVVLPLGLMNDIVSFLGTKPHVEVDPYIGAIRKNARVITDPKFETTSPKLETELPNN